MFFFLTLTEFIVRSKLFAKMLLKLESLFLELLQQQVANYLYVYENLKFILCIIGN